MNLTVSVVTVCRQNRDELVQTMESVLRQAPPVDSYVVIDGGSTDGTLAVLQQYQEKFDGRLEWVSEADDGISDAFNKGLARARGEAIIFLNAGDVFIDNGYCARAAGLLEADSRAAFVHADILFADRLAGEIRLAARDGQNLGRGMPYRHQTMLVRSEVFRQVGGFDTGCRIGMDYDHLCRMRAAGMRGIYDGSRPVVRMDGGGVSVSREREGMHEAVRSLKAAGLWNCHTRFGYARRWLGWCLRMLLVRSSLSGVLAWLKKRKYGRGV